jgi:hypothetical protein
VETLGISKRTLFDTTLAAIHLLKRRRGHSGGTKKPQVVALLEAEGKKDH